MSYEDHGMTKEEYKYVIDFCKKAGENEKEYIREALSSLPRYHAKCVYDSLTANMSYEKMDRKNSIYISKVDFYAYKRYGAAEIKEWMICHGIWEM